MKAKDMEKFQALLADPSVDASESFPNDWPGSAILYSFALRQYDYTKLLVQHKADVNFQTKDGVTPLKLALKTIKEEEEKREIVTMLVDAGASVKEMKESDTDGSFQAIYDPLMGVAESSGKDEL